MRRSAKARGLVAMLLVLALGGVCFWAEAQTQSTPTQQFAGALTSPGGANTQVQYNNSGAFGGATNFTSDALGRTVSIGDSTASTFLAVKSGSFNPNSGAVRLSTGSIIDWKNSSASNDDTLGPNGADVLTYNAGGNLFTVVAVGALTTTAAASDNVTINGMTASSHCQLTATNAAAGTNIATTFVSAKTTNQITVTHTATAAMTYDIACTAN